MVLKIRGCLKSLRISRKVRKDESDAKKNCWLLKRCDRCFPGVRCEKILLRQPLIFLIDSVYKTSG